MRSGQFEIFFEGSHCYFTDWYDSGFATFAVNAEEFVFKIDVADFQISGFRNAQTACVHHFKNGAVALGKRFSGGIGEDVEQPVDLLNG